MIQQWAFFKIINHFSNNNQLLHNVFATSLTVVHIFIKCCEQVHIMQWTFCNEGCWWLQVYSSHKWQKMAIRIRGAEQEGSEQQRGFFMRSSTLGEV